MDVKRFQYLVDRYEAKMLSEDESGELFDMVSDPVNEDELLDFFQAEAQMTEAVVMKDEEYWKPMLERILGDSRLRQGYVGQGSKELGVRSQELEVRSGDEGIRSLEIERKGRIVRMWRRIAVAAVVLLLAGAAWMVFSDRKEDAGNGVANQTRFGNDIAPAKDAVVLRLEDGSEIILDSTQGIINVKGNEEVVNEDGMLVYSNKAGDEEVVYHTVSTARGNQYQLQLSDGTKVWLNAASSIRFPSVFKGGERKVEVTGEAYFEVSKVSSEQSVVSGKSQGGDRTKSGRIPFLVESGGLVTEVLGTHFNVNSYGDEGEVKVTLLEGRVRVKPPAPKGEQSKTEKSVLLVPGQSAKLMSNDPSAHSTGSGQAQLRVTNDEDLEQVMAWKNGLFYFNNNSIEEVMRQLVRWYDAEVVYEGAKPVKSLSGQISRNVNLSKVLEMMELTGGIEFSIVGKKIVVRSK